MAPESPSKQSPCHLGISHKSPNCHQLPHHIFLNLIDGLKSLPFQKWFYTFEREEFWEKPEVAECQIWAVVGLSHLGELMLHKKNPDKMWCMSGHIVVMKLPIIFAHSCGLLNHPNSFRGGMFKLNAKSDADLLSHFECDGHTVHMLTQQRPLPPLASTVKWSLFACGHSGPLSLAARLLLCHINGSNYINNDWTFFGHCVCVGVHTHTYACYGHGQTLIWTLPSWSMSLFQTLGFQRIHSHSLPLDS